MQLLQKNRSSQANTPVIANLGGVDLAELDSRQDEIDSRKVEWIPAGSVVRCPTCVAREPENANFMWLDREGDPHCPVCEAPPLLAMVGSIVYLEDSPSGLMMSDQTEWLMPILVAYRNSESGKTSGWDDF